ncbi:MAG: hypothetical protein ABIS67_00580 [Candidatus Eisenbacteria bacterium]
MNLGTRVTTVNTWWEGMSDERFWLDVTDRDGRDELLAAPRGEGKDSHSWMHQLITHIKGGDIVFHYDASQRAIVAISLACGRVEKQQLWWPVVGETDGEAVTRMLRPSWTLALSQPSELNTIVPLDEIAGTQWDIFPALRALEDEVGDPLYYPFEMGNRAATRPLSGFVFKLPAVAVRAVPALARAAERATRQSAVHELVPSIRTAPATPQPFAAPS